MRITLIGSGNVATVLGRKLLAAGHTIAAVASRNASHAAALAGELRAKAIDGITDIPGDADIYIIAVSDDELYNLNNWKFTTGKIVVHTAGSVSRDVLKQVSENYGVFYPLQTLRKELVVTNTIPLLIDGSSGHVKDTIQALAKSISGAVQYANDDDRRKFHLAAVVVNNFSNHLYTLTAEYCRSEGIDFKMLFPLIAEGATRVADHDPARLQTGPAARNDLSTIGKQKDLLHQHGDLLEIYEVFTKSILSYKKQILP